MAEIKMAIKGLLATIFMLMLLQVRIGTETAEWHLMNWTRDSKIARQLRTVAEGGALFIKNSTKSVANYTSNLIGNTETQRASKFDFNFKRNPAVNQQHKNTEE